MDHVGLFLGIFAEHLQDSFSPANEESAMRLDPKSAKELANWALKKHTTRMTQMFLVPFLEVLCAREGNWEGSEECLRGVYDGSVGFRGGVRDELTCRFFGDVLHGGPLGMTRCIIFQLQTKRPQLFKSLPNG